MAAADRSDNELRFDIREVENQAIDRHQRGDGREQRQRRVERTARRGDEQRSDTSASKVATAMRRHSRQDRRRNSGRVVAAKQSGARVEIHVSDAPSCHDARNASGRPIKEQPVNRATAGSPPGTGLFSRQPEFPCAAGGGAPMCGRYAATHVPLALSGYATTSSVLATRFGRWFVRPFRQLRPPP